MHNNNRTAVDQASQMQLYKHYALSLLKIIEVKQIIFRCIFGDHKEGFITVFCLFVLIKYMFIVSLNYEMNISKQLLLNMTNSFKLQIIKKIRDFLSNNSTAQEINNFISELQERFDQMKKQMLKQSLSQFFQLKLKNVIIKLLQICKMIFPKNIIFRLQKEMCSSKSSRFQLYSYQQYFRLGYTLNNLLIVLIMSFFSINTELQIKLLNKQFQFNENQPFSSDQILKFIEIQPQKENMCRPWLYQLLHNIHYDLSHISSKDDMFGFKFSQIRNIYANIQLRKKGKYQIKGQISNRTLQFALNEEHAFTSSISRMLKRILEQNMNQVSIYQRIEIESQEKKRKRRQEESQCIDQNQRKELIKYLATKKVYDRFQENQRRRFYQRLIRTHRNE